MQVDAFFEQVRALPLGDLHTLTSGDPFLVLAPHPDDESLGTGGLIAAACSAGQAVEVAIWTDGAKSHPNSKHFPHDVLVELRRREAEAATRLLGLPRNRLTFLNLPDAQVPPSSPQFIRAVDQVDALVRRAKIGTIFTTWQFDPHCDHAAAAVAAVRLRDRNPHLRLWAYSIWGWHLDPRSDVEAASPRGFRFDVSPWREAKLAAIGAHQSQMTDLIDDDPGGFQMTREQCEPFLGPFEYFFEVTR